MLLIRLPFNKKSLKLLNNYLLVTHVFGYGSACFCQSIEILMGSYRAPFCIIEKENSFF